MADPQPFELWCHGGKREKGGSTSKDVFSSAVKKEKGRERSPGKEERGMNKNECMLADPSPGDVKRERAKQNGGLKKIWRGKKESHERRTEKGTS